MIKKILITVFLLSFISGILFISSLIFYITFFPTACIYGKNVSRATAVSSMDRGDIILPNGMKNINFTMFYRTSPFSSVCFMGEVNYDDFKHWCKLIKVETLKENNIQMMPFVVNNLKLKTEIIENGYWGRNNYGDVYYDKKTKTCYAYFLNGLGGPISLNWVESIKILFFSYFTNYWRDVEVKEPIRTPDPLSSNTYTGDARKQHIAHQIITTNLMA